MPSDGVKIQCILLLLVLELLAVCSTTRDIDATEHVLIQPIHRQKASSAGQL